ncbi:putative zinc-finger-containing protein [Mycena belliarum]|uniref:Zinc-finger-containing protein n=1 Tax=Mycena belliarum TaxID=1033014 RepID=A0AAD6XUA0_9AGAR|nr:putative zinc-finger-containing protein [Mycena belliae]
MPFNNDECYCAPCDLYFSSLEQRAEHIQATPAHPECDYCKRRFLNMNTLRNHFIYSRYHHYCASCEIEFQTPAGLRYHIEHAPVHCDDSDDEGGDEGDPSIPPQEWEEEMGQLKYPDEPPQSDDDSDDSWEAFDDYDYEDAEELKEQQSATTKVDCELDDSEGEEAVPQFSCPMCFKKPNSVCCAPCGHIFCSPCITSEITHTHTCPICSQPGGLDQLRKIFLA